MRLSKKLKVINDPVYNSVSVPSDLLFDVISHPYFQRLRRITQMGLSYLVYPGAHHTRFHHALGAMHLMQKAIGVLKSKGVTFTEEEEEGLLLAILLHDIGHGPFSHALEYKLVPLHHEALTLAYMQALNTVFDKRLTTAISIFKGEHPRTFLNQLVSSQLDVDRLDYLKRDSFYAGVTEGNINAERLINTFAVVDDRLVVEEKAIYSVEKFLMARRFMYWQVYLHKTSIVAELMLSRAIERASELIRTGAELAVDEPLKTFIAKSNDELSNGQPPTKAMLDAFAQLDDIDILSALKKWAVSEDFVLSFLSSSILNRSLLEVRFSEQPVTTQFYEETCEQVASTFKLSREESAYLVYRGTLWNRAYDASKEPIRILFRDGSVEDFIKASRYLGTPAFLATHEKNYICAPAL